MRFDVLTLFPGMFPSYLGQSVLNLAIERGLVNVQLHDIRDWARDKHRSVDDRPLAAGPVWCSRSSRLWSVSRQCGP